MTTNTLYHYLHDPNFDRKNWVGDFHDTILRQKIG